MKIFQEKQFLNRWWLLMFILAIIVIVVGTAYYATRKASEDTALIVSIISLAITIPIVFGLLYLRLQTRIDDRGITAYFKPFSFTRRTFAWKDMSECYVREYDPVKEFGGWGLRGLGHSWKSYNVYGNKGIQIVTKDGHKFLLGTQRPKAAKDIIKTHFQATAHEA
ncbi:MAG: hypothetical protein WBL27_05015 [Salinimicrobium sp.]